VKQFKIAKPIYLAVASLVFMFLNDLGVINITPEKYDQYVNLIALILMGAGIMTTPVIEVGAEETQEEKISE
jgi:hypothetical protein